VSDSELSSEYEDKDNLDDISEEDLNYVSRTEAECKRLIYEGN